MPEPLEPSFVGQGLHRPECVLSTRDGSLFTADWRGGVAHILPDGSQRLYTGTLPDGRRLRPNGISLEADGSFLIADLGIDQGGVFRLRRCGEVSVFLDRVDGLELPPTNFVFTDPAGRTWITVSTRHNPRSDAYRRDVADGFIVMVDARGARIVADGLGYTNEAAIDPEGLWLYANETFGRRLSRFPILPGGGLGARQVICTFDAGTYPDGLCFDSEGAAWVTSIISNRLIRIFPDGRQSLFLEDSDPQHRASTENAFINGSLGPEHLERSSGRFLKNISSLAFGGPDRRTAYFGCLNGDSLACLKLPVPGHPLSHWNYH